MTLAQDIRAIGDELRRAAAAQDAQGVWHAAQKRRALLDTIQSPTPQIMDVVQDEITRDAKVQMLAETVKSALLAKERFAARARSGYLQNK